MKYIRWTLAFAMICGASQALAGSIALPGTDTLGDRTMNYVFPSRADNTTNCQGMNTCPNSAKSPDVLSITVTRDGVSGKLLTIAITSSDAFPSGWNNLFVNTDSMGSLRDVQSWDYFTGIGGAHAAATVEAREDVPGDSLNQVIDASNLAEDEGDTQMPGDVEGTNQDGQTGRVVGMSARHFGRIGANALFGGTDAVKVKIPSNSEFMAYDSSKLSVPIYSGGKFVTGNSPYWGNNNSADDMMLVAGANDANDTSDVKKTETSTLLLVGMGTIATMVLFGMGIAGLAGKKK